MWLGDNSAPGDPACLLGAQMRYRWDSLSKLNDTPRRVSSCSKSVDTGWGIGEPPTTGVIRRDHRRLPVTSKRTAKCSLRVRHKRKDLRSSRATRGGHQAAVNASCTGSSWYCKTRPMRQTIVPSTACSSRTKVTSARRLVFVADRSNPLCDYRSIGWISQKRVGWR